MRNRRLSWRFWLRDIIGKDGDGDRAVGLDMRLEAETGELEGAFD